MVRHQAIAEHAHRPPLDRFEENSLESVEVAFLLEERQPSHPAIDRVIDVSAGGDPRDAWHGGILPTGTRPVKGNGPRPLCFLPFILPKARKTFNLSDAKRKPAKIERAFVTIRRKK